jgi:hypothetical protein
MPPSVAIVAGALASKPFKGGEAWVRLAWALGLRRLGFDVLLVEQVAAEPSPEATDYFERVTTAFDLPAALLTGTEPLAGMGRDEVGDRFGSAELLVNLSGNLREPALVRCCRRRVYVDLDPVYTQVWHAEGLDVGLEHHDLYLTVGARVGAATCDIPRNGIDWRFTPPPVVLEEWPASAGSPSGFTTVASWRGGYGRLAHRGHLYGQKAHEFRRLRELPARAPFTFEIALDIDDADSADRAALVESGWRIVDPESAAGDPAAFRSYVCASSAEFSVAQGAYVETQCGWVSDRSAHYLASGRPALVQDTGAQSALPADAGVVTFRSLDEAAAGAEAIAEEYDAHCRAARRLAEEVFDSDRVLTSVVADAGASP